MDEDTSLQVEDKQAKETDLHGDDEQKKNAATNTPSKDKNGNCHDDPLIELRRPSTTVRLGDHVLLVFADGRHIFAVAGRSKKDNGVKIHKRTYPTQNLVGLSYGTLLELERNHLRVLPPTESILPRLPALLGGNKEDGDEEMADDDENDNNQEDENDDDKKKNGKPPNNKRQKTEKKQKRDNRNLVDNNSSQALDQNTLLELRQTTTGSDIVQELIQNSATFEQKTQFSQAKYVAKKQLKYQPRCRLVPCTAQTVCQAVFAKDPKKIANLRPDTLAQILSFANVTAGAHVLLWEDGLFGLLTGAVAERMAGYGRLFSIYTGQQPSSNELIVKFNFPFVVQAAIKWVHVGDVLNPAESETVDAEAADRDAVTWPCPLQPHTKEYLKSSLTAPQQEEFLEKRLNRFARKLTRPSPLECVTMLRNRQVDSLIVAVRQYDATETVQQLWPFLAPSCPFVVFCEYLEPLAQCFAQLQRDGHAIHLRLVCAWTREYQVLPERTHPNMNMTLNGGYLLTGIKLDPVHGRKDDYDEAKLQQIRATLPTRRGKKRKVAATSRQSDAASTAVDSL